MRYNRRKLDTATIGGRVRMLRERNRLTQAKLAELLGVTVVTISGAELNRTIPTVKTLREMAKFFAGIDPVATDQECLAFLVSGLCSECYEQSLEDFLRHISMTVADQETAEEIASVIACAPDALVAVPMTL